MAKFNVERERDLVHRMRAVGVPFDSNEFEESLSVHQARGPFANLMASHYITPNHRGLIITHI
jgi:hypothetical protein